VDLTITDNGSGMSQEFIETELFTPFRSTKGVTGMGIGAYQVREYVRSLGGDVHVRSCVGEGSCFTLKLPMVAYG
jgi:signal transduction histidine kinase